MNKPIIDLINNESGDWSILQVDGETFAEGHSITKHDWIELVHKLTGVIITQREISDEDMEEGNY